MFKVSVYRNRVSQQLLNVFNYFKSIQNTNNQSVSNTIFYFNLSMLINNLTTNFFAMFSSTQPILSINTTDISSLVGVVFEFFANPNENNLSLIKKNTQKVSEMNESVEKLKNWAWQYADLEYAKKQFQKTQEVEKVVETTYNSLGVLMKSNISEPIHDFLQSFEKLLKNLQSYRSILENDLKNEEIQKELKTLTKRKFNIA